MLLAGLSLVWLEEKADGKWPGRDQAFVLVGSASSQTRAPEVTPDSPPSYQRRFRGFPRFVPLENLEMRISAKKLRLAPRLGMGRKRPSSTSRVGQGGAREIRTIAEEVRIDEDASPSGDSRVYRQASNASERLS